MKSTFALMTILLMICFVLFAPTAEAQRGATTNKVTTQYSYHNALDSVATPGFGIPVDVIIRVDSCARGEVLNVFFNASSGGSPQSGYGNKIFSVDTTGATYTIYNVKTDYIRFKNTTGRSIKTVNQVIR